MLHPGWNSILLLRPSLPGYYKCLFLKSTLPVIIITLAPCYKKCKQQKYNIPESMYSVTSCAPRAKSIEYISHSHDITTRMILQFTINCKTDTARSMRRNHTSRTEGINHIHCIQHKTAMNWKKAEQAESTEELKCLQ